MRGTTPGRRLIERLVPAQRTERDSLLVCVFLRGGADGLALVPPHGDPRLRSLRPTSYREDTIDLDGYFGLHPALSPLLPAFRAGELAIVHAVGSDDRTRSHFEAQDRMERAGAAGRRVASGWLARALAARGGAITSLTAVAMGTARPEALRGAPAAVLESADAAGGLGAAAWGASLARLWAGGGALEAAGRDALDTSRRLAALPEESAPARPYPEGAFGRSLRELARLVRADVGARVACVDLPGWDTHFVQAPGVAARAAELADGLVSFRADLGARSSRCTVIVMTEFGRRAYENGSLGTDHGRASVMLALGAGVAGGRVVSDWPGLSVADLEPPGDLRVTIDYRDVLAELLERRMSVTDVERVFPGHAARRLGVFVT